MYLNHANRWLKQLEGCRSCVRHFFSGPLKKKWADMSNVVCHLQHISVFQCVFSFYSIVF